MVKPGNEKLIGKIAERITSQGLKIEAFYGVVLTHNVVMELYPDKVNEVWFQELVEYNISGMCYVIEAKGASAVEKLLRLKRKIREEYSKSSLYDIVHSPDTQKDAERELGLFSQVGRVGIPPTLLPRYTEILI